MGHKKEREKTSDRQAVLHGRVSPGHALLSHWCSLHPAADPWHKAHDFNILPTASLHSEIALVWNNWERKKCFNNLAGGLP